jgi:uncharacterized protein YbjT (DUF2867 family)
MIGKTAIVAGATGLVGQELVRQLCANNHYSSVTALVRNPSQVNFQTESDKLQVRNLPAGPETLTADEFYCALGTTIKQAGSQAAFRAVDYDLVIDLAKRAKAGGVNRMVLVSAIGSDPNSNIFYSRVKGETERDLRALGLKKLDIYQPSLLLGDRQEFRLGEKISIILAPLYSWFLVGPLLKYRPIHAKNLAAAMIAGDNIPGSANR